MGIITFRCWQPEPKLGPAGWERLFGRGRKSERLGLRCDGGEKWIWAGAEWVASVFGITPDPNDDQAAAARRVYARPDETQMKIKTT